MIGNLQPKLVNQSKVPVSWPVKWEGEVDANSKIATLKIVTPGSQEYFDVECRCLATMPQVSLIVQITRTIDSNYLLINVFAGILQMKLIKLERIQNPWLWKQYALHKTRMLEKGSQSVSEMDLFHETRDINPQYIYNSEEGFDIQFSSVGAWGRGCYFAVNASYSAHYSHYLPNGEFQMFLAKVLTGNSAYIA
jgi:hypothetical protein